jgi:hypothetical protein
MEGVAMKNTSLLLLALLSGCVFQKDMKRTLVDLEKGDMAEKPVLITIKMSKYRPEPGHQFKDIYVSNFSVNVRRGKQEESSSRDGMSDDLKAKASADYGLAAGSPHSANPLFSDLMLFLSGIKFPQQSFLYCPNALVNSQSDDMIRYMDDRMNPPQLTALGLRDCEKSYLGLKPDLFDYDRDSIPDYLELRCGLNPRNPNDAGLSPTGDGVTHLEKCKRHIPLDESADSEANKMYAYQYDLKNQTDGTKIIKISNIPVLKNNGQNLIAFYIIEGDQATSRTYLYTAYSLITPKPDYTGEYEFDYWVKANDPNSHFNQQVTFP